MLDIWRGGQINFPSPLFHFRLYEKYGYDGVGGGGEGRGRGSSTVLLFYRVLRCRGLHNADVCEIIHGAEGSNLPLGDVLLSAIFRRGCSPLKSPGDISPSLAVLSETILHRRKTQGNIKSLCSDISYYTDGEQPFPLHNRTIIPFSTPLISLPFFFPRLSSV